MPICRILPKLFREMVKLWREGNDVVYGIRIEREGESKFKLWTAKVFYRLINRLSDTKMPLDAGDFRLLDRKVVEVIKMMPERARFLRGMVSWAGFRQVSIPYDRAARHAGDSKYPLAKMIHFAMDGIISFSLVPLKLAIWTGFLSIWIAVAGIIVAILDRLLEKDLTRGWASLFVAVLFMGGVQLVSLGIIGEYLGRIYTEVKRRPLYVVQERLGFAESRKSKIRRSSTSRILFTLLLIAISVRVLTLQFMRAHLNDPGWFQVGSYAKFDRQARDILDGSQRLFWIDDPTRTDLAQYPPAFPALWLSSTKSPVSVPLTRPRSFCGWRICFYRLLLIAGIAVSAFGWRAAIASSFLVGLSPLFAMYAAYPSADIPSTWFVLGGNWLLLVALQRKSVWYALAAGAAAWNCVLVSCEPFVLVRGLGHRAACVGASFLAGQVEDECGSFSWNCSS